MRLVYRPDWPEAADRLARWWRRESIGRPALGLTAPRDNAQYESLPRAPNLREHWTNPAYVIPRVVQSVRNTAWFAEACPVEWVNLGAVSQAGFLGTKVICAPQTIWHKPFVEEWTTYTPRHDPQNEWWQITLRLTEAMLNEAEGKWFVANADLAEAGDIMSALRGPQAFCMDLMESSRGAMERVRDEIVELLFYWYQELTTITARQQEGTSTWLRVWHPRRTTTAQCDFSCMISKEMFDEFLFPALARQTAWLDDVIYHLDGPGALQHIDTLLKLPNLRAIQWVPGEGAPKEADPVWRPLIRRIINAGIAVHLTVAPTEVEDLVREFPPEGLYLAVNCGSEREARELLVDVERWS
ncbi:MAG: hypothetical protein ACUVX8_14055 [Candidatus Zipacnadales bacterium]